MASDPGRARRRSHRPPPWRGHGTGIALALVAVVPLVALFGLRSWSLGLVESHDGDATPTTTVEMSSTVEPPAPALSTAMLGFRRVPTIIARDANTDDFAAAVSPLLASLDDRSCGAVSVDSILVGERNATIAVIPASTQKIPVAAVALQRLGADFRYTTEVVAASRPVGGVIEGDLFLVGGGDPLLSSDWYPGSRLEANAVTSPTSLDVLADRVVEAGVTAISGSVVGDGSRYDDEFFAPGWGPGVAGIEAGPYDALMANDSRVRGDPQRNSDPSKAAAREFSLLLQARGVNIAASAGAGVAPLGAVGIASVDSAPLSDVVAEMLANSDNNTAELLLKEIGRIDGAPGSRESGLEVMREQLTEWGVDIGPLVLADGSGLSLDNRLTCAALLNVLQQSGFDSALGEGLPVAGRSGTLADVFADHPVAGRLRGKTGTLSNPPFNVDPPAAKALAGFLPVSDGAVVEYVLILNSATVTNQNEYRPYWYQLADALATYPAGASAIELGPR